MWCCCSQIRIPIPSAIASKLQFVFVPVSISGLDRSLEIARWLQRGWFALVVAAVIVSKLAIAVGGVATVRSKANPWPTGSIISWRTTRAHLNQHQTRASED